MTGPSRMTQMTSPPATDRKPETERAARGAAPARPGRPGCPEGSPPRTAPPAAAAGLAGQLTRYRRRNPGTSRRRREQCETTRLVLGATDAGEGVLHERDRGGRGLSDDRDVQ